MGIGKRIVIIGAGAAGTVSAIRLLRYAADPLDIVLLERNHARRQGGIAYSADTNTWSNVFNIQIGRMSPFRDDPDDFLNWANSEADRSKWGRAWRGTAFGVHDAAPRRLYQLYLRDRLQQARGEAADGVVLREAHGEAVDLEERIDRVIVTVRENESGEHIGGRSTARMEADHVVLATGVAIQDHALGEGLDGHPALVDNEYSAAGIARIAQVDPGANVVVIGTLLSAFDAVNQLLTAGHRGTIHMVSRHGELFEAYPDGYHHEFIRVRRPPFLDEPYRGKQALVSTVVDEWRRDMEVVARDRPDIPRSVRSERILKGWEPFVPALLRKIPPEDVRALLNEHAATIATHRVGSMGFANQVIREAMRGAAPQVVLDRGVVLDIARADERHLEVHIRGDHDEQVIRAGLVIRNLAQEHDYASASDPLWQSLIGRRALASPHRRTGRGVEVGPWGELRRRDGDLSPRITVVGVPREGDEIERHGRLGAFAMNIAAIKDQCVRVAVHVLAALGDVPADEPVSSEATLLESLEAAHGRAFGREQRAALIEGCGALIDRRIRYLVATTRADREFARSQIVSLSADLAKRVGVVDSAEWQMTLARFTLAEAVRRITDFSIPPRELRKRLLLRQHTIDGFSESESA